MKAIIYISAAFVIMLAVSCNRKTTTGASDPAEVTVIGKADRFDKLDTKFVTDTSFITKLQDTSASNIFVKFEQTPCYGKCPTFEVIVYQNGYATLHGISNYDLLGHYKCHIPSAKMVEISEAIEKAEFFDMADSYPVNEQIPTDLPKTKIQVQSNGSAKQVVDNKYNTPAPLLELEHYLNDLWISLPWEQL